MKPADEFVAEMALANVRVAKWARCEAATLTAQLLAEQGADILDLSDGSAPPGARTPDSLAEIDVLISDTGSIAPLGPAEFDELRRRHPSLVSLHLRDDEGAANVGPVAPSDGLASARWGYHWPAGEVRPVQQELTLPSSLTAVVGAGYIAAALLAKRQSNHGQQIDLSLTDGALLAWGNRLLRIDDERYSDPTNLPKLRLSAIYECSDGRFVQPHGNFPKFIKAVFETGGHPEWVPDATTAVMDRAKSWEEVRAWELRLAAIFKKRAAFEWEQEIHVAGGACTVCRDITEWVSSPQALEAGIIQEYAESQEIKAGPAVVVSRRGGQKGVSENSGAVDPSAEPGMEGLPQAGPPLAGLRVLDLCIIIAGPTCGRALAELGADVVKLDALDRPFSPYAWLEVNRGKRSIIADLSTPDGQGIFWKLVDSSDVIVENFRMAALEKFGITRAAIFARKPSVVLASLNAFDHAGPFRDWPGWEQNAQAISGMQVSQALAGVPRDVKPIVTDYSTGVLGAYGVLLALLSRSRDGEGRLVQASLARTATFLQSLRLSQLFGKSAATTPPPVPVGRVIRCNNGWCYLETGSLEGLNGILHDGASCTEGEVGQEYPEVLEARGGSLEFDGPTEDLLERAERQGSRVVLLEAFPSAGVVDRPGATERLIRWDHQSWGRLSQVSALGDAPDLHLDPRWPAPNPGTHTEQILQQLGFSQADIDGLVARRSVETERLLFSSQL